MQIFKTIGLSKNTIRILKIQILTCSQNVKRLRLWLCFYPGKLASKNSDLLQQGIQDGHLKGRLFSAYYSRKPTFKMRWSLCLCFWVTSRRLYSFQHFYITLQGVSPVYLITETEGEFHPILACFQKISNFKCN